MKIADTPLQVSVTTGAMPASTKVWVEGVVYEGLRETTLSADAQETRLRVYDSSGPYTDPGSEIDIETGLPRGWLRQRDGVADYSGHDIRPADDGFVSGDRLVPEFPARHRPRRSADGGAVKVVRAVHPELERLAIEAVRTWRFCPAARDGVPIDVFFNVAVAFNEPGGGGAGRL